MTLTPEQEKRMRKYQLIDTVAEVAFVAVVVLVLVFIIIS